MLDRYVAQARLLLSVLPDIATEAVFALKGGTAINLFYRDMPRLSVDIDLTYLPVADRQSSLEEIDDAFNRIATAIAKRNPRVRARRIAGGGNLLEAPFRGRPLIACPVSCPKRNSRGDDDNSPECGGAPLRLRLVLRLRPGRSAASGPTPPARPGRGPQP